MAGSFTYSFTFLPNEERRAIRTIYAFARTIDDIVDNNPSNDPAVLSEKRSQLNTWREVLAGNVIPNEVRNGSELLATAHRYQIPASYFLTLIDGCERDLSQKRYSTFQELKEYCYGVASIVGLMCIEIFGYRHDETRQYAINLGYALQLTNILRDVRQDMERGTIYLPLEDLERFQYTEADIANNVYDDRFTALMEFQVGRARDYYHKARTLLRPDERTTMVAAEIMDAIYYRLLDKIELNDYRVYHKRIRVSTVHKMITALRIWVGSKLFIQRLRG